MEGSYKKKEKRKQRIEAIQSEKPYSENMDAEYIYSEQPDFSKSAISKEIKKSSLQGAGVLYPAAIGILGGLAALVLGPSNLLVGAAIIGSVIAIGSLLFNLTLGKQNLTAKYLKKLHQQLAQQTSRSIKRIGYELNKVNEPHGLKQLDLIQKKYEAFKRILGNKFNVSEISYSRYMGMVEQVFLAALDNLKQIADITQGINVIDENHIVNRIQQLRLLNESTAGNQELDALVTRFELLQKQRDKVKAILSQNETAMTKMDEVMAAISIIDTSKKQATMDMDDAMKELESLAARAQSYSSS